MMNIIDPSALRFDDNHGTNVVLSNDGQRAERIRGHDNAIIVCRYPLLINRVFEIRLEKVDPTDGDYKWLHGKRYMSVGVAVEAPSTLSLPGEANEWGYAVVINNSHVTLKGQYLTGNEVGRCLENLPEGSTVGLSMDHQDCLRLYINGVDQGVALRLAVPFPLYAFFELIGPYKKPSALRFDDNHGTNVVLSNDGQTAERIRGHDNAIIVCRYPLLINRVFEIRLEKVDPTDGDYKWLHGKRYMSVGVAVEAPSTLSLPGEANEWGYAVVINNSHVTLKGQYLTGNEVGRCLENLPEGSTVGLSMDHQDCLRLYINGVDQGVALRLAVPFPLYAFFELIGPYKKVSTLPIRTLI